MNDSQHSAERLDELLADQTLVGLTDDERNELARLMATSPIDPESFDRMAARVSNALRPEPTEPLPESLKQKILSSFDRFAHSSKNLSSRIVTVSDRATTDVLGANHSRGGVLGRREMIAWSLATASLVGFVIDRTIISWISKFQQSPSDLRAILLHREPDVIQANWKSTEDPSARGVTGDVIWSSKAQNGFLRIHGLAKNEPFVHQYQLWIFDAERDERYPIDGGVFNVDSSDSELIIRIDARLRVNKPTMFAVTIEKRGGVVVSKRERLLLTASPIVQPA